MHGMQRTSPAWDTGPEPEIAALISTYRRREYLEELLAALAAQELARGRYEVVIVDNGSDDGSWERLQALAARTSLRLRVLRIEENRGPAAARNAAVAAARAPLLAFTDDDCLPAPAWLAALLEAFADDPGVVVIQGRVRPAPGDVAGAGPWDHYISVEGPGPLFETCNVAYRRSQFDAVGGFDGADPLLRTGPDRPFGEDALLGWRVLQASGGRAGFAATALVDHRCVPATYAAWLRAQRRAARFPGLARRSPLVARWLRGGVFLTQRTAAFDLALAGTTAALLARRPWPLLLALPWLRGRWADAGFRVHGHRKRALGVLAGFAVADAVQLASLLQGGVRYRRVVL